MLSNESLVISLSSKEHHYQNLPVVNAEIDKKNEFYEFKSHQCSFVTSLLKDASVPKGQIMFNKLLRIEFKLIDGDKAQYKIKSKSDIPNLTSVDAKIKLMMNLNVKSIDTNEITKIIQKEMKNCVLNKNQPLILRFQSKIIGVSIDKIQVDGKKSSEKSYGFITPATVFKFELLADTFSKDVYLTGTDIAVDNLFSDTAFDGSQMGIGGLDKEVAELFRRVFASRLCPVHVMKQMGVKHIKGFLLYGPPGTGKTLIARKIAQTLKSKPPKLINGPEILDKYIGESERKLRELFVDAENDHKKFGDKSMLHVIIFDELDAICRQRGGSGDAGSRASDNIVNQLLAKIDGLNEITNLLIIGMTNRPDLIDDALTRPGRLEVKLEISLPDENGRVQILKIHTNPLSDNNRLGADVDLEDLAKNTQNFTGAEIEGLVRAAVSHSYNEYIKKDDGITIDPNIDKARVSMQHFKKALAHDVHPAFGSSKDSLNNLTPHDIILWNNRQKENIVLRDQLLIKAKNAKRLRLTSVLVHGRPKSGTSAFAANLAMQSGFDFVRVVNAQNMVGRSEMSRNAIINKLFQDAYKCENSCIFIDDFERIIDYNDVGPRFSNTILQTLLIHLKSQPPENRRLLLVVSTSRMDVIQSFQMKDLFSSQIEAPMINGTTEMLYCLHEISISLHEQCKELIEQSSNSISTLYIGVKTLIEIVEIVENLDSSERAEEFLGYMQKLTNDIENET